MILCEKEIKYLKQFIYELATNKGVCLNELLMDYSMTDVERTAFKMKMQQIGIHLTWIPSSSDKTSLSDKTSYNEKISLDTLMSRLNIKNYQKLNKDLYTLNLIDVVNGNRVKIRIILTNGIVYADYSDIYPFYKDESYLISDNLDDVIKALHQMVTCYPYHKYLASNTKIKYYS